MKTILTISLVILLSSCSYKHWQNRGFKKGWIDTTTKSGSLVIELLDSLKVANHTDTAKAKVDTIFQTIFDVIVEECPQADTAKVRTALNQTKTVIDTLVKKVSGECTFKPRVISEKNIYIEVCEHNGQIIVKYRIKTQEVKKQTDYLRIVLFCICFFLVFYILIKR